MTRLPTILPPEPGECDDTRLVHVPARTWDAMRRRIVRLLEEVEDLRDRVEELEQRKRRGGRPRVRR